MTIILNNCTITIEHLKCNAIKPEITQPARRVIEYLTAYGPRPIHLIAEGVGMSRMATMDAIIEARDFDVIGLSNSAYYVIPSEVVDQKAT